MSVSFPGRAVINPLSPEALGICDRCGFQYNLRDLRYQKQWAGAQLITLRLRVCDRCYDVPNEQFRTIRIPPDPVSVSDPRPEDFTLSEYSELFITKYIGWDYMFGQNVSSMSAALDQKVFQKFDAAFSDVSDGAAALRQDQHMSPAFSDVSDISATLQRDANMSSAFSDVSDVAAVLEQTTPSGYSFNMTAGDATLFQGYGITAVFGADFGSIDAEPLPSNNLGGLASGVTSGIVFQGDATALLAGLTVWVDTVEYPFDGIDWTYDSGGDSTSGIWDTAGPTFVDTVEYFVEIK